MFWFSLTSLIELNVSFWGFCRFHHLWSRIIDVHFASWTGFLPSCCRAINKKLMNMKPRWILDNFRVSSEGLCYHYLVLSVLILVNFISGLRAQHLTKIDISNCCSNKASHDSPCLLLPSSCFLLITFNVPFTLLNPLNKSSLDENIKIRKGNLGTPSQRSLVELTFSLWCWKNWNFARKGWNWKLNF